eukprot:4528_1
MDYEIDSSDEDIGLTNNKHVNNKRLQQYEQTKEKRFCYAMVIILLFAISVVTGLFIAMSLDDVMIQQTPIKTVTNLFFSNNNTKSQSSKNNHIEITDDWKTQLQTKYNVKFSANALRLLDISTQQYMSTQQYISPQLNDGHILTNIIFNDSFHIPFIYEHAYVWNIKYPYSEHDNYEANIHRKWCFNFYLYNYDAAQIDIKFNKFQIEKGFDRIIIRHFNQSIIDPPLIISGRGKRGKIPSTVTYHIWKNEFKSICIELQTDNTINLSGIDFNVSVRYDDCVWSNWYGCHIADQLHKNWSVQNKPYYNGKCGIGVDSRIRTSIVLMKKDRNPNAIWPNGFVNWAESSTYGPKYCIKANCNNINGQIDPKYPDLIAILPSYISTPIQFESIEDIKQYMQSSLFMNTYSSYPNYKLKDKNRFNIDSILSELIKTQDDITQYTGQQILLSVLHNRLSKQMEYLGARLVSSLLIGRTFSMTFIGYDNTAGYKYQFANSYPIQLQSQLRMLWQRIGVDGAAFNVRNIAIGGLLSDNNYLQLLYSNIRASDSAQDIIIWEYTPNTSQIIAEIHLRMTAILNAIWSPIILLTNNCKEIMNVNNDKYYLSQLFETYNKSVGMMTFNFTQFLDTMNDICIDRDERYLNQKINRIIADILAYNILDITIKFIRTYKKVLHTNNVLHLHEWLLKKSGNWNKQDVFKSIPVCGTGCDQLSSAFALTAFEPNEWNVGNRLEDYIYNMTNLELFGWKYTDFNRLNKGNPSHYPQDRLGDIGSMDRKNIFIPDKDFFREQFDEFLRTLKNDDTAKVMKEQIESVNKDNINDLRILKQGYYRKYKDQFMEYIIDNDFVLKIAILIPNVGAHSIFIGNRLDMYELLLSPIITNDSENKELGIDFNEILSTQRKCNTEFIEHGCLISSIPSNKYILSIIPKNILLLHDLNDIDISITSLITF